MKTCPSGKKILDKKGAMSLKNLTMKLHHIKMGVYECHDGCGGWHNYTISENKRGKFHSHNNGETIKKLKIKMYQA